MRRSGVVLLLASCAPTPAVVASPVPDLPTLPVVLRGPAAEEPRARRCDLDEAAMGPITVAGNWHGGWQGCRTGPSPGSVFKARVHNDALVVACLERAGVTWLDGRVRVSPGGRVVVLTIDELDPVDAVIEPCLLRVTRYQLLRAGCEIELPLHFAWLR